MTVRNAISICLIVEAGLAVLGVINHGWGIEGLQATTRFSGRFSLLIFSLLFLASRPSDAHPWLSKKPFHLFALAHGVHLVELLAFLYFSGTLVMPYRLLGGAMAYFIVFSMPFLADRHEQGRVGARQFNIMGMVFQYYLWGIFFLTYLPRVRGTMQGMGGSYVEYVVLLGWVSLMLGMKLPRVMFKGRR